MSVITKGHMAMRILKPKWDFASQASGLASIEFLVNNITRRQLELMSTPNRRWGKSSQEDMYRGRIITALPDLLALYQPGYVFSELIDAFWLACYQVGLLSESGASFRTGWYFPESNPAITESVDALIGLIPDIVLSAECQRRAYDRRFESREKEKGIEQYIQAVLNRYARSLLVRVDLGFLKECQSYVTIDYFYQAIDRLRAMQRNGQPFFEDSCGFVLSLEQGVDRGFHAHLGVVFNGSKVRNDWYRAEMAKDVWAACTNGMGTVYNCNANKGIYERSGRCGLGMVDRDDWEKRANVVATMQYMADPAKEDQYLRIKPTDQRAFWKGRLTD